MKTSTLPYLISLRIAGSTAFALGIRGPGAEDFGNSSLVRLAPIKAQAHCFQHQEQAAMKTKSFTLLPPSE
jgi:hypothetical protein